MVSANFLAEELDLANRKIQRINYLQGKRKVQEIAVLSALGIREKEIYSFIVYLKSLISKGDTTALNILYDFIANINKELSLRRSDPYFFDYKLNNALKIYEGKLHLLNTFKSKLERKEGKV